MLIRSWKMETVCEGLHAHKVLEEGTVCEGLHVHEVLEEGNSLLGVACS